MFVMIDICSCLQYNYKIIILFSKLRTISIDLKTLIYLLLCQLSQVNGGIYI